MKRETSQVANELIKRLDAHLNDERIGNPCFPERGVRPFPLTTDGFKVVQHLDSDRKTAFVDGGNQEVFGAPNFSVQLNRVYFGMWSGSIVKSTTIGGPRVAMTKRSSHADLYERALSALLLSQ